MAVRKASEVPQGGTPPIERDRYVARILSSKFGESNSGNKQITLECEIAQNGEVESGGKKYPIGGTRFFLYLPMEEDKIWRTFKFHEKLDLPDEVDDEDPDLEVYNNLVFEIILNSREKKATKPNPAKPGTYMPIKDKDGKEITNGYEITANVDDVLGLGVIDQEYAESHPW